MKLERGSVTVEAVLLTPVLATLLLVAVHGSRLVSSQHSVQLAADHGARHASMVRFSRMDEVGNQSALSYLTAQRSGCVEPRVNVAVDRESERPSVMVEVECTVDDSGLAFLSLLPTTVAASSVEVIDVWRADE